MTKDKLHTWIDAEIKRIDGTIEEFHSININVFNAGYRRALKDVKERL